MEGFLFEATVFLLAAVVAVPVAMRLGLGSVLGYLIAGIVIGPVIGFLGPETEDLRHFAEFGVVLMLFLIGLELEPRTLWDMRRKLVGLGGLQVGLTTLAVTAGAWLLGMRPSVAVACGLILALSSTAIVLQTLEEKGLTRTPGGRSVFAVLLTQDIAVIPMLILLPLLALTGAVVPDETAAENGHAAAEHAVLTLFDGLPAWGVTLTTLGAVAAVVLIGLYAIRPAFRFIEQSRLREMHTAFALLIVIGIATLMNMVGLSPALGTFLAGVVLASSEFRHELESDIEPFKGLLLGLFFITVGAGIDFALLFQNPWIVLVMTVALMLLKAAILFALARLAGLEGRDGVLFTLSLAQAGEFGFVLTTFAVGQAVLPPALGAQLNLVIALSMLLTPLSFIVYERVSHRMRFKAADPVPDAIDEGGDIIIAGIGRFGQIVNRVARASGFKPVVLDSDLETVQLMRRFGFKGFFGDPTRPEILAAAGLDRAEVLVVALDNRRAATRLVSLARQQRPGLHIIARAYDRVHVYELYRAGADQIVREMFDSSLRAGRYVLEAMGLTDYEAHQAETAFYHHDRESLRELAELWDPDVPVLKNPAYMERARTLNADEEAAIVAAIGQGLRVDDTQARDAGDGAAGTNGSGSSHQDDDDTDADADAAIVPSRRAAS